MTRQRRGDRVVELPDVARRRGGGTIARREARGAFGDLFQAGQHVTDIETVARAAEPARRRRHVERRADGHQPAKPRRLVGEIQRHVQRRRAAERMRHHEQRHARVPRGSRVDEGKKVGAGAGVVGAARQPACRSGAAHVHPQQAEPGLQHRPDQPQDVLRLHAAVQPVDGDDAAFRGAMRRMEGGHEPVAVVEIDQDLGRGRGRRRVMAEEMPHRLQIAADPGQRLAAEGRHHGADVIAKEARHEPASEK